MTPGIIGAGMRMRAPFVALLIANMTSYVGAVLAIVAIPWFVLVTTDSAAQTGITGAVQVLAFVLSGILGGTMVDRIGFRRASIGSDVVSAVPVAAIPLLHHTVGLSFWQLLVLVFVAEFFSTPGTTARESLLPELALQAGLGLERANAIFHAVPRVAQLLGPALAGVLIALVGSSNVLYVHSSTFVLSAFIVGVAVPGDGSNRVRSHEGLLTAVRRYGRELREGVSVLAKDRLLTQMTLNNAFGNMLGAALGAVVLPVYAREVFGNVVALGVMSSAYGAGALAGVVLYGAIGGRWPRRLLYTVSWILVGLPLVSLVALPGLIITAAVLVFLGIGSGPNLPLTFTVAQERIPEAVRGRFFGLRAALANAASPLGLFAAGYLIEMTNLQTAILLIVAASIPITANVILNSAFGELNDRQPKHL